MSKSKCARCGAKFRFKPNKRYCSDKCRVRNWQEKKGWKVSGYYDFEKLKPEPTLPTLSDIQGVVEGAVVKSQSDQLNLPAIQESQIIQAEIDVLTDKVNKVIDMLSLPKPQQINFKQSVVDAGVNAALDGIISTLKSEDSKPLQRKEFRRTMGQLYRVIQSKNSQSKLAAIDQARLIISTINKYENRINLDWIKSQIAQLISILKR